MSTWAIGDVQGCFEPLTRLLDAIDFRSERDRLVLVGDLVNRGPESLEVLRWARSLGDGLVALVGNHDLHLLAVSRGLREIRPGDTLAAVLAAPDRADLLEWLAGNPFLHREQGHVFVHAALHPSWDLQVAELQASRLHRALQGEAAAALLENYQQDPPERWSEARGAEQQQSFALAVFTRLRCLCGDGRLSFDFTGPLKQLPSDRVPWWRVPGALPREEILVCGHWAAVGVHQEGRLRAIDSGCVWGRSLSAYCLDDGRIVQVAGWGQ